MTVAGLPWPGLSFLAPPSPWVACSRRLSRGYVEDADHESAETIVDVVGGISSFVGGLLFGGDDDAPGSGGSSDYEASVADEAGGFELLEEAPVFELVEEEAQPAEEEFSWSEFAEEASSVSHAAEELESSASELWDALDGATEGFSEDW